MKKKIGLLAISIFTMAFVVMAQSTKPTWSEMSAFHSLMAATFHPTEDGNFAPLKAKADSLLIMAQSWKKSPIPSDYKPTETRAALVKLENKCLEIKEAVKRKEADANLKKMIGDAHDIFHTIIGECRKTDG